MILVTGGGGYVGCVVVRELMQSGLDIVALDNLSQGHVEAVSSPTHLVVGDLREPGALDRLFSEFPVRAVIHMAAETEVERSLANPRQYFDVNVTGGLNLLNAMVRHGVNTIVFSSSAAVYGEPESVPIDEAHPKRPVNAYGESKLMFETILHWYGLAYGVRHVSFRYFNAAGAVDGLGESHNPETHLIPNVLRAALGHGQVAVFGTDYPTKDGSCVRDFVHVRDIARAHIAALDRIEKVVGKAYNLGTERGSSVLEVIRTAEEVTGREIPMKTGVRRAGDPAVLVASSSRVRSDLGWEPQTPDLRDIIRSAWRWLEAHPNGYRR